MELTIEQYKELALPILKLCKELSESPRLDIPELDKINKIAVVVTSMKPEELKQVNKALSLDDCTKVTEKIPTWAFGYIFNGDRTALNDEEIDRINYALRNIELVALPTGEEYHEYFCHRPMFGAGADVVDCVCFYRPEELWIKEKNNGRKKRNSE